MNEIIVALQFLLIIVIIVKVFKKDELPLKVLTKIDNLSVRFDALDRDMLDLSSKFEKHKRTEAKARVIALANRETLKRNAKNKNE